MVVRPPVFWLWEESITPPGPAMVRLDRKDLNSKTKKKKTMAGALGLSASFRWWFAHLCLGLGRSPITLPGPAMVLMDRKDLN